MGMVAKYRRLGPKASGTIASGAIAPVTLGPGVEYLKITNKSTSVGNLEYASRSAYFAASTAYSLAPDTSTDNIAINPLVLYLKAVGGDVDYEIFSVLEGQ